MKILFVNPIGQLGGAERALLDLIASLSELNSQVRSSILSFSDGPLLAEAARLGASASVVPLPPSLSRLGDSGGFQAFRSVAALGRGVTWLPSLARRLSAEAADVIHTNGLKAHALVALARPAGVPVAWHMHDFLSSRPFMRHALPMLQSRAAVAIAVSEAVAKDARGIFRSLPVVTVLNAVRTADFRRADIVPADLDALAGLSPSAPGTVRIGLLGTLATWKGHEVFFQAAHRLRHRPARFYFIGGSLYSTAGSQRTLEGLRSRLAELQLSATVGLVPFQLDVPPVLAALDIVVHASTRPEPFGRVVAEGMSAGCAVVAAASGGVLEQIEDGRTGLLFPAGDSTALTERIASLLESSTRRANLGRAAASFAATHLDAGRLGPTTYQIYEQLCQRSGNAN